MKEKDLPQDPSALASMTRELQYVQDESGKYTTGLSKGWDVKRDALDFAWKDIEERVEAAKKAVESGEKSPIYYYMELKLMDFPVLTGYTGYWKFTIRRHMKPVVFARLSERKLRKYAAAFEISTETLRNFGK